MTLPGDGWKVGSSAEGCGRTMAFHQAPLDKHHRSPSVPSELGLGNWSLTVPKISQAKGFFSLFLFWKNMARGICINLTTPGGRYFLCCCLRRKVQPPPLPWQGRQSCCPGHCAAGEPSSICCHTPRPWEHNRLRAERVSLCRVYAKMAVLINNLPGKQANITVTVFVFK